MKPILLFLLLTSLYLDASDLSYPKKTIWIDVRTRSEYDVGHLEDAILIPFDKVAKGVTDLALPLNTEIYLYCRSGKRAQKALHTLKEIGYETVINMGSLENALKNK